MSVAEDMFPLLTKLDKREKLRLMQFLVSDLVSNETEVHPDWPPEYFSQTFGAFRDDPLERPDQGKFEIREELA